MAFNLKKHAQSKIQYEHTDKYLEKNRKDRGHDSDAYKGTYENHLGDTRKDKDQLSITDKQLDIHHENATEDRTIEARMNEANLRDDRTWKTNTLPINELAEEAQRARMDAEGKGDGLIKDHYQQYKKEDLGLSKENFAELKNAIHAIDELWMASSKSRLTTSERKKLKQLTAKRDSLLG